MSAARRRIAVYGEIDPNLVDGSSVWLQSICQVLASLDGVEVTLLLRRPLEPARRFLLADLEASGDIEMIDAGRPGLLEPAEALDLLGSLDRERGPFDVVLLRGQAVLAEAAEHESFAGRLWSYAMTGRGMPDATLRALAARSHRLLCQTEAVAQELREIVPEANGSILVLPPMIPDRGPLPERDLATAGEGPLRLVYSGKLAPEYCWLETVETFRTLREAQPNAELHVLGDKVHRPPDHPQFHESAVRALRETEGLRGHGAVPRAAVHGLLAECDLALSIRDPGVEAAREISTKVLEYGAAGLPVVLNRATAYERLLGEDYPFFVDTPQEAAALLLGPALDPGRRVAAASACHAASRDFTFDRVAERLSSQFLSAGAGGGKATKEVVERLFDALTAGEAEAPEEILDLTTKDDADPVHLRHLTRFVFRAWAHLSRTPERADGKMLQALARRSASREGVSQHVRTALDYLSLWVEVTRYFEPLRGVGHRVIFAGDDHLVAIREKIEERGAELSTTYGRLMFEGMLMSIRDRSAAAELFRAARAEDPDFANAQRLDDFAATYFTAEEIGARHVELAERRTCVLESFEPLAEQVPGGKDDTLLLFSCDPTFLVIYFPYWASIAEYLKEDGVSMHFVVTGDTREGAGAIERALTLGNALSDLRRSDSFGLADSLSFSTVAVPGWVENPKTFYACARYLLARDVAKRFNGRVLVLDVDMVMRANPVDFLRRHGDALDACLPVVMSKAGMSSLIPARRYGAATFPVPRGELGDRAMRHIEDYMCAGLSCPISWTLDQNALNYAADRTVVEYGPDALLNIADSHRPFAQEPIRRLYETGQRRRERSLSPRSLGHPVEPHQNSVAK
jgi:glycosyltransferase involved in cell wall biosynthesis